MQLKFDFNNMLSSRIGKHGVSDAEINKLSKSADSARKAVYAGAGSGWLGWMNLPYNQSEVVQKIKATAADVRKNFDTFVVLGIGGSALGPMAVFNALKHLHYNELPADKRGGPRFYVEDNIDPERMLALLDVINIETTMFNCITKSGATSETMSQFLIIYDLLKSKLGADAAKHIIATTDAAKGNLVKIAKQEGFEMFVIPDGVGGRFSELCPVGLLPAAVTGIDIDALLDGARDMSERCKSNDIFKNPALLAAMFMTAAMCQGKNISVMFPYADSLKLTADWYCQLWGESLGKRVSRSGKEVFTGQTPVKALGVTDQHSQVQLYAEGPFDKVVTFVGVEKFRSEVRIPDGFADIPDVAFLGGHTLSELMLAEQRATEFAITKAGRPNFSITLPEVNAFTIGQLLQFYMLQTAFCGEMLDIDAFDQPGVEEGKNATYALFGKPGYQQKKAELDGEAAKNSKYIL